MERLATGRAGRVAHRGGDPAGLAAAARHLPVVPYTVVAGRRGGLGGVAPCDGAGNAVWPGDAERRPRPRGAPQIAAARSGGRRTADRRLGFSLSRLSPRRVHPASPAARTDFAGADPSGGASRRRGDQRVVFGRERPRASRRLRDLAPGGGRAGARGRQPGGGGRRQRLDALRQAAATPNRRGPAFRPGDRGDGPLSRHQGGRVR